MNSLPQRTNLVTETLRALKDWIRTGAVSGMLPGEIRLAARLGVSRATLRLALNLLDREGWITTGGRGRQRRVRSDHPTFRLTEANRNLPVTFLSPYSIVTRDTLLEFEELQRRLAEQGREFRVIGTNVFRLEHPEPHLSRLVDENPSAAWILHLANQRAQRWFEQRGLPAFILSLPFPEIKLPYLSSDWESAAFHAGGLLLRRGHRRIGLLEYEDPLPGAMAIENGLQRALAARPADAKLLVLKEDRTPVSVARALEAAFRLRDRPTALVFSNSKQLLACMSWMLFHGISVPRDVSLISIVADNWYRDLHPPICHYKEVTRTFARLLAQRVMELVETGQVTHKSIRARLEYFPGSSVGPVPDSAWRLSHKVAG